MTARSQLSFHQVPQLSQNRGPIGSDVVTECGGNYNPANYLEPNLATALLNLDDSANTTSAYYSGGTFTDTSAINMAIAAQGHIIRENATTLKRACPTGSTDCTTVANDQGLPSTSDQIFSLLRKRAAYRGDINAMLDRMVPCLRDAIAAGPPLTLLAPSDNHSEKKVGRIPDSICYDSNQIPRATTGIIRISCSWLSAMLVTASMSPLTMSQAHAKRC